MFNTNTSAWTNSTPVDLEHRLIEEMWTIYYLISFRVDIVESYCKESAKVAQNNPANALQVILRPLN